MILAMNLRLQVTFVLGDIGSSQVLSGNSKKSISNDQSYLKLTTAATNEQTSNFWFGLSKAISNNIYPGLKLIKNLCFNSTLYRRWIRHENCQF